jgi:transposase
VPEPGQATDAVAIGARLRENAFGRLKDWRRIATRYDRCATIFFGAITLATIVTFWLGQ